MPEGEPHESGLDGVASNGWTNSSDETASDESASPTSEDSVSLPYAGFSWTEGGIIVGVGLLLATVSIVGMLTSPCCAPANQTEMMRRAAFQVAPLLLWIPGIIPIFWACARLRPPRYGWGLTLAGHVAVAFAITFATEWGQNMIYSGIVSLWPPPESRDFTTQPLPLLTRFQFSDQLVPYLIYLIIGLGRYEYLMSRARRKRNKRLEREAEQLRAQLTAARLEALRMQINPHFLFNTLHTVATMAGSNPEGVRTATARLSEMLRYALSTSDQQEVPLGEELDILESYLDIQKLRLEERLITDLDIEPGTRRALIPTLLLQPLAENAVKHGFKGSDQPGRLVVRVRKDGGTLVLTVADNGAGLSAESTPAEAASEAAHSEEEHGLQNIAERLDGLYGDDASLDFERSAEGGLAVVIRLPYHTRETERDLRVSAVPAE